MNSNALDKPLDQAIINKARNDLIFNAQGPAILVVCGVVLGFAFSISEYVNTAPLVIWTCLCIASYIFRYLYCFNYSRATEAEQGKDYWQTRFIVASCLSGVIWGAAAFAIFPTDSPSHQLFLILLVVFLASATTVTHSAYRWASISFSSCSLLPMAIKLFLIPQSGHNELASIVVGFFVVMVSSSFYLSKIANRIFYLSHENAELISDLRAKNNQLEEYNHRLEDTKKELSHANDSLQKLVTTDALTGLTSRRRFDALTKLKWQRCASAQKSISVLIINIDNFKQFNDFYGHRKGDSCLLSIGAFLSQMPEINRQGDCVARYSGDEFAILLVDAPEAYAKQAAEGIRKGVELLRIPCSEMPGGTTPWVSVSVGAATESSYLNNAYEDLFEMADKAMYMAKRSGRNQVHMYSDYASAAS